MSSDNDKLRNQLNSSGFPLQLAVEDIVRSTVRDVNVLQEVPWSDTESGVAGFIDIVAQQYNQKFVIECKRPRGDRWIFIPTAFKEANVKRFRICCTIQTDTTVRDLYCDNVSSTPVSFEAGVCVVGGQSQDQRSSLERISSSVLLSLISLANEEIKYSHLPAPAESCSFFIPIIVTCAKLFVALVDPKEISLGDGTLHQQSFLSVPFVRFRKSLLPPQSKLASGPDLNSRTKNSEATVFIVNSESLSIFLRDFNLVARRSNGTYLGQRG